RNPQRKRRGGAVGSRQTQKRTRETTSTPEISLEAEPIELVETAGDEIVDLTCESLEPVVVDLTHNDSVVIVEERRRPRRNGRRLRQDHADSCVVSSDDEELSRDRDVYVTTHTPRSAKDEGATGLRSFCFLQFDAIEQDPGILLGQLSISAPLGFLSRELGEKESDDCSHNADALKNMNGITLASVYVRSERKDSSFLESGVKTASKLALSMAPKGNSVLHLPLWVCPDCRRTVEKEERHSGLDQPQGQDFLLHSSLGGSQPEASGAGRLALGTQTMSSSGLGTTPSDACSCEACSERRDISAETDREPQQLQNYWSEVRYMVRCIYRQAGTPLAEDQDQSLVPDKEGVKELVDRLCERDPYQLYQRLEQQAREYVLEMKVRLLRQLSAAAKAKAPSGLQGPPQAHHFVSLLLEEYGALCQAARSISTFLGTL
ncbi:hypothetical protein STEG23_002552, partial [Scotinomys teguina]